MNTGDRFQFCMLGKQSKQYVRSSVQVKLTGGVNEVMLLLRILITSSDRPDKVIFWTISLLS